MNKYRVILSINETEEYVVEAANREDAEWAAHDKSFKERESNYYGVDSVELLEETEADDDMPTSEYGSEDAPDLRV